MNSQYPVNTRSMPSADPASPGLCGTRDRQILVVLTSAAVQAERDTCSASFLPRRPGGGEVEKVNTSAFRRRRDDQGGND